MRIRYTSRHTRSGHVRAQKALSNDLKFVHVSNAAQPILCMRLFPFVLAQFTQHESQGNRACQSRYAMHTSTSWNPITKCVKSIQNVPSLTPVRSRDAPPPEAPTPMMSLHLAEASLQSPFHSPTPCGLRMRRSRTRPGGDARDRISRHSSMEYA